MVQVNKENRTIAVTATETVSADSDVAHVSIGYQCYGVSQNEAYANNVRTSSQIFKALEKAGIAKEQIETGTIKVDRVDVDAKWTDAQKRDRQYEAEQAWKISVSAKDAARIIDLAMRSGANKVEDITWDIDDHAMLQAKAGSAALAKAHSIADQMAKGLGAKLGQLIYASNQAQATPYWLSGRTLNTESASIGTTREEAIPQLSLFPEKVKQDATVYAVFSIE
jgi:hypothetical protein